MERKILFVCTGNYYRSRYAAIYFNHLMGMKCHCGYEAFSKGFRANSVGNIGPLSKYTVRRMIEKEIPFQTPVKFPEKLTLEDITSSHMVVVLKKEEHLEMAIEYFPDCHHVFEYWDIHDIDCEEPNVTLDRIEAKVEKLIEELLKPA